MKQIANRKSLSHRVVRLMLSLVTTWRDGMGWGVGGRLRKEGTYVCLWLTHAGVWQKPTHWKAIILQLKVNKFLKRVN